MASLSDIRVKRKVSCHEHIKVTLKIGRPEHSLPPPPTSDNISFLPPPPSEKQDNNKIWWQYNKITVSLNVSVLYGLRCERWINWLTHFRPVLRFIQKPESSFVRVNFLLRKMFRGNLHEAISLVEIEVALKVTSMKLLHSTKNFP